MPEQPFGPTERKLLLAKMTDQGMDWYPKMALVGRGALTELLTIMSFLQTAESRKEQAHLKRMGAIERTRVPLIANYPGDYRFWDSVDESLGKEYQKAKTFETDLRDLPRSWRTAASDLASLETAIRDRE